MPKKHDVNDDGKVDLQDALEVLDHFGEAVGPQFISSTMISTDSRSTDRVGWLAAEASAKLKVGDLFIMAVYREDGVPFVVPADFAPLVSRHVQVDPDRDYNLDIYTLRWPGGSARYLITTDPLAMTAAALLAYRDAEIDSFVVSESLSGGPGLVILANYWDVGMTMWRPPAGTTKIHDDHNTAAGDGAGGQWTLDPAGSNGGLVAGPLCVTLTLR